MKSIKIFAALMLFGLMISFSNTANAQFVERKAKDSVTIATKYLTWPATKPGTTGFQITVVKDTGTLAGTVTLERRIDTIPTAATSVWMQVGSSYTITNTTGAQAEIFPISVHDGNGYRFKVVTTGGKAYLYGAYLRW
ncbi:MAG: hypothetical protein WKF88_09290 [Ferruginibacter sp.]